MGGLDQAHPTIDEVYRAYACRIRSLALRLSSDAREAEELTQETFVRAWKALPAFRGESHLVTWLHRIAVRAAVDMRRETATRRNRIRSESELTAAESPQYGQAALRPAPDIHVDLERAIAALPRGARIVLVLHGIEGYSQADVAAMLDVSVGTVKSQLHRARRLLIDYLDL